MRDAIFEIVARRRLDLALVCTETNIRALCGIKCDSAILAVSRDEAVFYTDFRYIPMARRLAPAMKVRDISRFDLGKAKRIGYENGIPVAEFERLRKRRPSAKFVAISDDLSKMRATKTPAEIAKMRAAAKLNGRIWKEASVRFRAGMSEREMAGIIRKKMIDFGDGEAFDTIVCVGANAAECHHEPDDTVWNGRDCVLVDMGVKLDGYCSDMTRNILPKRASAAYKKAYKLVRAANRAAIAAAAPGISGKKLDAIARRIIAKGGFGKCFWHSLGHGVGLDIHEAPTASKKSKWILEPGMVVTIEPGIYLEGNFGIRIEDMVLITEDGCEILSEGF